MDLLIIAVLGILAIAAASQLSDRIGVAPALILLVGGTAVGFRRSSWTPRWSWKEFFLRCCSPRR